MLHNIIMAEIYKSIVGFENYEVSNCGNVRNIKTNRMLRPRFCGNGYHFISLRANNKTTAKMNHRLVAETFLDNPDAKQYVDHIDNNKVNNNLVNLRYATNKENAQNAKLNTANTSGTKGVYFSKSKNKWCAQIKIDGIQMYLGSFDNKEDAIQARVTKANQVFGIFTNSCEKLIM
jgi:hypothetical protein